MKSYIQNNYRKTAKLFRLIRKVGTPQRFLLAVRKTGSFFSTAKESGILIALRKTKNFLEVYCDVQDFKSPGGGSPAQVYIGSCGIPANSYESHYEADQDFSDFSTDIKALAFYLPQFHTFPENDLWWGKGFTEWTNTRKAEPQFPSHYQPREPNDDIGYYDLSDWRVLKRQAELARRHGIYGFCIYHYWFSGKQLMEKVVDILLEHPEIDIPFCLCWANENWTRSWDGLAQDVLIAQKHENDDLGYIRDLKKYLLDPRYIRIDGKPLVMVYRPGVLPDAEKTFRRWRSWARENGLGELVIWVVRGCANTPESKFIDGTDGEVEFPPAYSTMPQVLKTTATGGQIMNYPGYVNDIVSGKGCVEVFNHPVYRGAMLGWDCTPRRKAFHAWYGFSPEWYYRWLCYLIDYTRKHHRPQERFLFINAWNEWAEGTYLEPDKLFGYTNINMTSRALFGLPIPAKLTSASNLEFTRRSGFFDEAWYTGIYRDITAVGMNPLIHYTTVGWKEGRSPSEQFPNALYLFFNPHLKREGKPPIIDYLFSHRAPTYLKDLCSRFDALQESTRRKLKIERVFLSEVPLPQKRINGSTAVHLHLFYEDMIPKLCNSLKAIPASFDLLISIPEQKQNIAGIVQEEFRKRLPRMGKCLIEVCPNRGRDIAPMLCSFNARLKEYDYFCHIHTKKSPHTAAHSNWANFIYSHLFGDENWCSRIFFLLEKNAGIVYPPDFLPMYEEPSGWGSNLGYAQEFIRRQHPEIDLKKDFPVIEFPQGSMFWARSGYLQTLLDQQFAYTDFPKEPLGMDGSPAHALERLFFLWGIQRPEKIYQVFRDEDRGLFERKRY